MITQTLLLRNKIEQYQLKLVQHVTVMHTTVIWASKPVNKLDECWQHGQLW